MFPDTIAKLIQNGVSENGSSLLFQRKDGWSWKQITWKDFESEVKSIAAFIADAGFGKGDRAFFESCGTHQGLVAETAVLMLGGVAVSGLPPADGKLPLSKIAFAASGETASRIAGKTGAEKVIFFSGGSAKPGGTAVDFAAAAKFGFLKSRKMTDLLQRIFLSVGPESPAVEVLGESGAAKTLSQGGFMEMLGSAMRQTGGVLSDRSQTFCDLPRADMFSRAVRFLSLCARARAAANEADFFEDILEIMPTVVFLDSRRLEEIAVSLAEKNRRDAGGEVFGGRLKDIFTDRAPSGKTAEFYSNLGVKVSEVSLNG